MVFRSVARVVSPVIGRFVWHWLGQCPERLAQPICRQLVRDTPGAPGWGQPLKHSQAKPGVAGEPAGDRSQGPRRPTCGSAGTPQKKSS
jgi:hypothetical protein